MLKKIVVALAALALTANYFSYAHEQPYYAKATKGHAEKPIVVVIPSYNNEHWYKLNLGSIFGQKYENYKVIYINDCSPDKTGQLVEQYIKESGQEKRTTLINNPRNYGAMANIYKAVHSCDDQAIIVTLDGDDWLKDENVFNRLNEIYQDPNVWMTYGQYEELHYKQNEKKYFTRHGHCKQIPPNIVRANAYRETAWLSSHLRTFYAGLFKQIKLQDFLTDGNFYKVSWDMAFMIPLLEMAKGKFKFIEDIVYVYNCITPLNDFKTKLQRQLHVSYVIRAKEKYNAIESPFRNIKASTQTDLVILAEQSPAQLYALLESVRMHMPDIATVYVIHNHDQAYQAVANDFKNALFVPTDNLKTALEQTIAESENKYLLLAKDNMLVTDSVDIHTCVKTMEHTYAHGFYLSLGKNIQQHCALEAEQKIALHAEITQGIHAWQFKDGQCDWKNPHNLAMTLYRKSDILPILKNITYDSSKSLEQYFNTQKFDMEKVGLFFEKSKVVTLKPENKSNIVELFNNGMKINILPFFLLKNTSTLLKTNLSFDERKN